MIGIGPGVGVSRPRGLFRAIQAMFSQGEKGVAYDPSDMQTLFQDSAGTTPVTAVGQPVGLMLDKSQGLVLGPELVTNGKFDTGDTTGWAAGAGPANVAIVSNQIKLTHTGTINYESWADGFSTVVGNTYKVVCEVVGFTGGGWGAFKSDAAIGTATNRVGIDGISKAAGVYEFVFVATSTTSYIHPCVQGVAGNTATFDNISVRELPGYHATQATSTARPVLGRHPITGRRNLLTYTEDFSNAAWLKSAVTVATGNILTATAGTAIHRISAASSSVPTAPCIVWFDVKAGTHAFFQIANGVTTNHFANFDLANGVVGSVGSAATSSIEDRGNGVYRCKAVWSGTPNTNNMFHIVSNGAAAWAESWNALGTETINLIKAQSELGSTPTAYQKVVSTYDVTEAGVNDAYHLKFDGVDDFMVTPSIDFSATDKMSVFAGVQKLSDALVGTICELSANAGTNAGAFLLFAPTAINTDTFGFYSRGSLAVGVGSSKSGFVAPITSVLTGLGDIASDIRHIKVNGGSPATNASDQGTGNFGNYPLYIGMRAGTAQTFNGHLYSLVVRGALSDAAQIVAAEAYANSKTGAWL